MSLEERLEKAEKLVAEVKAELAAMRAEKATKRNWPERIEAGMVFRGSDGNIWECNEDGFACILGGESGATMGAAMDHWLYLGHARDILTIRTDAREPTGEELVGKVCEFSDSPTGPWSPGLCAAFGHNPTYQYRKAGGAEWKYAMLAK